MSLSDHRFGVIFLSKQTWVSFSRNFRVWDSNYTIVSFARIVIPKNSATRPKWPSAISFRAPKQFVCCVCVCCRSKWVCVFRRGAVLGPLASGASHSRCLLISSALECVFVVHGSRAPLCNFFVVWVPCLRLVHGEVRDPPSSTSSCVHIRISEISIPKWRRVELACSNQRTSRRYCRNCRVPSRTRAANPNCQRTKKPWTKRGS